MTTIGIYKVISSKFTRDRLFANGKRKAETLNHPQPLLKEKSNLVNDELRNKVMLHFHRTNIPLKSNYTPNNNKSHTDSIIDSYTNS